MAMASKAAKNHWARCLLASSCHPTKGVAAAAMATATATAEDVFPSLRRVKLRGAYVPVYVALGLIVTSAAFGLHTARLQLAYAPNVFVDKRKRETVPEVVMPDWALTEAELFILHSVFRKVAHLQDFDAVRSGIHDPVRSPTTPRPPIKAETLKTVGVEPPPPPERRSGGLLAFLDKYFGKRAS